MTKEENKVVEKKTEYQDKIAGWKKEFGSIFKTTIDSEEYIWKKLKRKDYTKIMTEITEEDEDMTFYSRQEAITKAVVLHPENITELIECNAGLANTISNEVLSKAGFKLVSETEQI